MTKKKYRHILVYVSWETIQEIKKDEILWKHLETINIFLNSSVHLKILCKLVNSIQIFQKLCAYNIQVKNNMFC